MSRSLDIVRARWPRIAERIHAAPGVSVEQVSKGHRPALEVAGVRLEGAFDPDAEAALQARLVPESAATATVYGLAQGSLARVLLGRPALRRLRVVILSPSAARASLERLDHAAWLTDERVELVDGAECDELEAPFAAAPASLRLASNEAARIRDLVRLELATPHLRRDLARQQEEARSNLEANAGLLEQDGDVAELFGTAPGTTIQVAAAGPSLAEHFERLRAATNPLIAVDAALGPLVGAGIVPQFVVSVDAHEHGPRRLLEADGADLSGCRLIYFPVVAHEALRSWPGSRLAAAPRGSTSPGPERGPLFSSGSVLHPAVDLAVRMGAQRVELFGADFAIPGGQSHVRGSAWQREYEIGAATPWVLNGEGERVPTFANLIGYLRDLERYLALHPEVSFVNAGRTGAAIAGTVPLEASHAC